MPLGPDDWRAIQTLLTSFNQGDLDGFLVPVGLPPVREFSSDVKPIGAVMADLRAWLNPRPDKLLALLDALSQEFPASDQAPTLLAAAKGLADDIAAGKTGPADDPTPDPALVTAQQADSVVAAINAIRAASNQQVVQQQVENSRVALASSVGQLQTLNAYKAIHDQLHGLQTDFYQPAAAIVGRNAVLTADQGETIALVGRDATRGADTIKTFLDIADGDDGAPSREWHDDLVKALGDSLQMPIDRDRLIGGLRFVRGTLRQELTIYDAALARVAGLLPLDRIVALLRDAGKLDKVPDSVAAAAADLTAMSEALGARVELHRQWQLTEATLWLIEQELDPGQAGPNSYTLSFLLDQLGGQLAGVKGAGPDTWDSNIDDVLVAARKALADKVDPAAMTAAFAEMIRIVRLQFSKIDKLLLSQCDQIVKLGKPLRQLLAGGS